VQVEPLSELSCARTDALALRKPQRIPAPAVLPFFVTPGALHEFRSASLKIPAHFDTARISVATESAGRVPRSREKPATSADNHPL